MNIVDFNERRKIKIVEKILSNDVSNITLEDLFILGKVELHKITYKELLDYNIFTHFIMVDNGITFEVLLLKWDDDSIKFTVKEKDNDEEGIYIVDTDLTLAII